MILENDLGETGPKKRERVPGSVRYTRQEQITAFEEFFWDNLEETFIERGKGVTSDELHKAWLDWSEPNGWEPQSKTWIARRIQTLTMFGEDVIITVGGDGKRVYRGLQWQSDSYYAKANL